MRKLILAAGVAFVMTVSADTLTWKGGTSGEFSNSANWTSDGSHGSPQPGDTLKFTGATTLTAETFDLGGEGVTIENGAAVTSNVKFTGSGVLSKTGKGALTLKVASTHTGGTTVSDGRVIFDVEGALGTGTATLARDAGRTPNLLIQTNNKVFANPVKITGPYDSSLSGATTADLTLNNNPRLMGAIESEGSLRIFNSYAWNGTYAKGNPILCLVTVTGGGTLYADGWSSDNCANWLANVQNCSVVKKNDKGGLYFADGYRNETPDAVITNQTGDVVVFKEGSFFAGREVVLKGAKTTLVFEGMRCLGDATVVKLLDGAQVKADRFVCVGRLFIGEQELSAGIYGAGDLPGTFGGAGVICVGLVAASVSTWRGGSLGDWTVETNWDNGVPTNGQIAVFNSATVVNAGTVDIGPDGLTVFCGETVRIATNATFAGVGRLTKGGVGMLRFENWFAPNTYAGGTELLGGALYLDGAGGSISRGARLGPGPLVMRRTVGVACYLWLQICVKMTNAVTVLGPYTDGLQTFRLNNDAQLTGPITAEDDIRIVNEWVNRIESGSPIRDIDAHGHTVHVVSGNHPSTSTFDGTVDASLEKSANSSRLYTAGHFVDPGASYTILGGTNYVSATATIACTNIVVSNVAYNATLQLNAASNLSPAAKVSLWKGGKLQVTGRVKCLIAELWVEGVKQPCGIYSEAGVPSGATCTAASFTGTGRIQVGMPGSCVILR